MPTTISGNVGGASFSGAIVYCSSPSLANPLVGAGDASGNFTFSGLVAGTYTISAYFPAYVYRQSHQVQADGVSTYSNVNLNPTAINASNAAPPTF